jgi:hypothetical protein
MYKINTARYGYIREKERELYHGDWILDSNSIRFNKVFFSTFRSSASYLNLLSFLNCKMRLLILLSSGEFKEMIQVKCLEQNQTEFQKGPLL